MELSQFELVEGFITNANTIEGVQRDRIIAEIKVWYQNAIILKEMTEQ